MVKLIFYCNTVSLHSQYGSLKMGFMCLHDQNRRPPSASSVSTISPSLDGPHSFWACRLDVHRPLSTHKGLQLLVEQKIGQVLQQQLNSETREGKLPLKR